jgi:hypothetical protein
MWQRSQGPVALLQIKYRLGLSDERPHHKKNMLADCRRSKVNFHLDFDFGLSEASLMFGGGIEHLHCITTRRKILTYH